jgi:hypothetical protein
VAERGRRRAPRRRALPAPPHLDRIAWRVLADLCRPDGEFSRLPPEHLAGLIGLRLAEEAERERVPLEALADAFDLALREFTGAGRRPPADA